MVDFGGAGGHLGPASAVKDRHLVGPEAKGAARGIHGDVAAADDGDAPGLQDGRVGMLAVVGPHEVRAREVLVRAIDAEQFLARDAQEHGGPCPDADEDRVVFPKEFLDGVEFADDGVRHEFHPPRPKPLDFLPDDGFREPELRNPIHQDAARLVEGLEDGGLVSAADEFAGAREAGGAGTHDGHLEP